MGEYRPRSSQKYDDTDCRLMAFPNAIEQVSLVLPDTSVQLAVLSDRTTGRREDSSSLVLQQ